MAQPSEDKHRPMTAPLALHAMAHPLRLKLIGLVGGTVALTALYLGTRPSLSSRSSSRKTGACMSADVRSIASSSVTKLDANS
jgi:hypothetical protein